MLTGYPKTDVFTYAQIQQGGYAGYWDANDQYQVAPPGNLIPYFEAGEQRGYEFSFSGGSIGRNLFGEGAVAGTPGTLPTNWEKSEALGITGRIQYVGALTEARKLSIEFAGVASGTGTGYQINFGPFASPTSLPAAVAGANMCYDIHALDYYGMNMSDVSVQLGLQPFDASNALLTPALYTLTLPYYPINLRDCRHASRSGSLPSGTARLGMFLRVNVNAGADMNGRRLWIAMPCYASRGSPGNLPGYLNSSAAPVNGAVSNPAGLCELVRLPQWLNPDEGTFCVRFKLTPTPAGNGNTRCLFGFTNYIGTNVFMVQMSTAISPNLQVISTYTGGSFTRNLSTSISTNVWHRMTISYKREAGVTTILSSYAPETSPAIPIVYLDTPAAITPFLFGSLGSAGSAFRTTRNNLGGYIDFFDYYPFAMDESQVQAITGQA